MNGDHKVVKWYNELTATMALVRLLTLGLSMWSLHGLHIPAESSPVCISESKEIIQEFCKNSQQLHMTTEILEMY